MSELPKPLADIWANLSSQRALLIDRLTGLDAEATLRSPGSWLIICCWPRGSRMISWRRG